MFTVDTRPNVDADLAHIPEARKRGEGWWCVRAWMHACASWSEHKATTGQIRYASEETYFSIPVWFTSFTR